MKKPLAKNLLLRCWFLCLDAYTCHWRSILQSIDRPHTAFAMIKYTLGCIHYTPVAEDFLFDPLAGHILLLPSWIRHQRCTLPFIDCTINYMLGCITLLAEDALVHSLTGHMLLLLWYICCFYYDIYNRCLNAHTGRWRWRLFNPLTGLTMICWISL